MARSSDIERQRLHQILIDNAKHMMARSEFDSVKYDVC